MEKEPLIISNKSCKTYFLIDNLKVYFTGDFDSGNLEKAQQISPYVYRLTPGYDKTRQTTHKTFFHFKTHGFKHCKVKFIIAKMHMLKQFINENQQSMYHPVVRRHINAPFEKLKQEVKMYYNPSGEPELSFSFNFEQESWAQFAFTYPYSYEDCEMLINDLTSRYSKHNDIYFHDQVLCRTSEARKVHLITITDQRNIGLQRQSKIQSILQQGMRPFKINRPRIIFSARVHPGEAPSSFCMEGVLKFLLNQKDYRSYLLRKNFEFVIIPMINPQGVFEGMYRNDLNGQNLNRMYLYCDQKKHKSIWSIKKYLQSLDRVDFFFDLHAHPSKKGFFIYGNALEEFLEQTQAQIFSKMIQYNCPYFENLDCIYSEKAMASKDKYDNYTKQGCARVYYHKLFKMIHSYTVECGYFAPNKLNPYHPQRQFNISTDYICTNDWEAFSMKEYMPQNYMMLGKSILISIIDLFHINPYTRISTSDFKSINNLRKFTAHRVYNQVERFRLVDSNCYRKIREIAKIIEEIYYIPRFKPYGLTISENYGMKHRKKSFSLNIRNPLVSKSISRGKELVQSYQDSKKEVFSSAKKGNDNIEKAACLRSSSQKQLPFQLDEPFSRYLEVSISIKKRTIQNSIQTEPFSSTIKRKDFSFSKQLSLQKLEYPSKFKQMEEQIIKELLHSKLKTQMKRSSQAEIKIQRLGSFLRRESKSIKLPSINTHHTQESNV